MACANDVVIRVVREFHVHLRAAAEVDIQRNAMPEQHRTHTRDAEDQRKRNEVPLLAQEIYIRILKKFHAARTLSSVRACFQAD